MPGRIEGDQRHADQLESYSFRSAKTPDASRAAELIDAAYGHYVERIGMLPGPMTDDYAEVIRNRQVTVAEKQGIIVGVIVLALTGPRGVMSNRWSARFLRDRASPPDDCL